MNKYELHNIEKMNIRVRNEAGFDEALEGLSYNHFQEGNDMLQVVHKLAHKDFGHNKFLEAMIIWVSVKAPRYWWQEADTYRLSSKQSESSMHIHALGRDIQQDDFIDDIPQIILDELNTRLKEGNHIGFKRLLPESFLQRRLWVFSYKTLRNIFIQRSNHKLLEWHWFLMHIMSQIEHPEFITPNYEEWLLSEKEKFCV